MLKRILGVLLMSVVCANVSYAGEDPRTDRLKKIDIALAATETSRTEHCSRQTDPDVRAACNLAYDMIVDRQKAQKSQLSFMLSIDRISAHTDLKTELHAVYTVEAYNKDVAEVTDWILAVEKQFQTDRQFAQR